MENIPLIYGGVMFTQRPSAVPYNYRISYKVAQVCLILNICGRGDVCSLIKLHMISFALFSNENMEMLIKFANDNGIAPLVRFDPAVNKALTFAKAYGLVEQQASGKFKLTAQGKRFAMLIQQVGDLMVSEIGSLNRLSKKLIEGKVDDLIKVWSGEYAEN